MDETRQGLSLPASGMGQVDALNDSAPQLRIEREHAYAG